MATHKAYRLHSYGGPKSITLDEVPIPQPGKSDALVAVTAVGMNPFDWKIREGYTKDHLPLQLPTTIGVDFAGKIVSLPSNTSSGLKVGDRVMSMSRKLGAHAEHIVADESILARVPPGMDDITAATIPIPVMTAWQTLHAAGPITPGSKVLIHGASGLVGAFAIQFAKTEGATVIGTASGKNKEYVLGLGADVFVDYQTQKFDDVAKDVDLILDFALLGANQDTLDRSWKILKPNGAIVSAGNAGVLKQIPDGFRGFFPQIMPDVSVMEKVAQQIVDREISSKVAQVFPRAELVKAMEINKAGGTAGRLVVDFTAE